MDVGAVYFFFFFFYKSVPVSSLFSMYVHVIENNGQKMGSTKATEQQNNNNNNKYSIVKSLEKLVSTENGRKYTGFTIPSDKLVM